MNSGGLALVDFEPAVLKGDNVFEVLLVDWPVELLELVKVLGYYFDGVFSVKERQVLGLVVRNLDYVLVKLLFQLTGGAH